VELSFVWRFFYFLGRIRDVAFRCFSELCTRVAAWFPFGNRRARNRNGVGDKLGRLVTMRWLGKIEWQFSFGQVFSQFEWRIWQALVVLLIFYACWSIWGDRSSPLGKIDTSHTATEVERGGTFRFTISNTPTRDCEGNVERLIIDAQGNRWTEPNMPITHKKGKVEHFERDIQVPIGIACGPATYQSHVKYWCNFFQQFCPIMVEATVRPFTVKCDGGK
jgi:hypothetical protein